MRLALPLLLSGVRGFSDHWDGEICDDGENRIAKSFEGVLIG